MAETEIIKVKADISELQKQLNDIDAKFNQTEQAAGGMGKATETSARKGSKALKKQDKALQDNNKSLDKFSKGLNGLARRIGAAFAAAQVLRFAQDMQRLAIEMEQVDQKAKIVFGDALPQVTRESEKAANALGLTNREFRSAAAGVADILVPLGFARDQSAQLAVETTKLAGAISNWSGGQYTAAQSSEILQKALVGETEQLKSVGIVVDQSSKQFNQRLKVIQEDQDLTLQQARALDILNQVTSQSLDAQEAFATGAENIAVQQAKADAKAREAKEAFAEMITPAIIGLTEGYADTIESLTNRLIAFGETGFGGLFDPETGKNIRTARKEIDNFADEFLSQIDNFDENNMVDYFNQFRGQLRKTKLESDAYQSLTAEQQDKINQDILFEFEILLEQEAARRKRAEQDEKVAAAQKGILESLKEQLKTTEELIDKAQSQGEINRLLTKREEIEKNINDILTARDQIEKETEVPDFGFLDDFEASLLEQERLERESFHRREKEVDEYYDAALEAKIESDEQMAESNKMRTQLELEQERTVREAMIQTAANMFQAIANLAGDNAEVTKAIAIFDATLNAYKAIASVYGDPTLPTTAKLPLAVSIGALAFAQVAKISQQEVPKFYEGTDFVPLNGNKKGKDTVSAMLHEGEAVIPSDQNRKYPGLAKSWIKGDLDKYISAKHVKPVLEKHREQSQKEKAALMAQAIHGSINARLDDTRMYRELKRSRLINQEVALLLKSNKTRNPYRAGR